MLVQLNAVMLCALCERDEDEMAKICGLTASTVETSDDVKEVAAK